MTLTAIKGRYYNGNLGYAEYPDFTHRIEVAAAGALKKLTEAFREENRKALMTYREDVSEDGRSVCFRDGRTYGGASEEGRFIRFELLD